MSQPANPTHEAAKTADATPAAVETPDQATGAAVPTSEHVPLKRDLRDTALVLLCALPVVAYFLVGELQELAAERSDRHFNGVAHEFSADEWQQLLEQCERWHAELWPLKESGQLTDADRVPGPDQDLVTRLGFTEVSMIEEIRIRFYEGNRAMKFTATMPHTQRPPFMRYRPLPQPAPELPDTGHEFSWDAIHIDQRHSTAPDPAGGEE